MKQAIAIGTTTYGHWIYKTVVLYESGPRKKDNKQVWKKKSVLDQATTKAKIKSLAEFHANRLKLPLMPSIRHNDLVEEEA